MQGRLRLVLGVQHSYATLRLQVSGTASGFAHMRAQSWGRNHAYILVGR